MNRRDFLVQSALSAAALWSLGRPPAAKAAEPQSVFEQVRAGRPLEGVDAIDAHAHFDVVSGDLIWPVGVDVLDKRGPARDFIRKYKWGYPSVFDPTAAIRDDLGFIGQPVTPLEYAWPRQLPWTPNSSRASLLRSALTARSSPPTSPDLGRLAARG